MRISELYERLSAVAKSCNLWYKSLGMRIVNLIMVLLYHYSLICQVGA